MTLSGLDEVYLLTTKVHILILIAALFPSFFRSAEYWSIHFTERHLKRYSEIASKLDQARDICQSRSMTPQEAAKFGIAVNHDGVRRTAFDLLAFNDIDLRRLSQVWPELGSFDTKTIDDVETDKK